MADLMTIEWNGRTLDLLIVRLPDETLYALCDGEAILDWWGVSKVD